MMRIPTVWTVNLVSLLFGMGMYSMFAFLPQFVAADEASPLARMLELSGVFMAMTFAVFALYGAFAALERRVVDWTPRSEPAGGP